LIAALFLFASPVDVLAKSLFKGGTAISADYFRNVLTVELCVILSAWIIPLQYSPSTLLPVVAGALLFGLIGVLILSRKIIAVPLVITCLFLVQCYVIPGSCPNIGYWIMTMKDSLSEQYPALIAVLIVGLLVALFFNKKAIGIAVTIMVVFLVYCYIFPQHVPIIGDKVKRIESNLTEKIERDVLFSKSLMIITIPAGADVYINGQYNVEISEQNLKKSVTLKMPSYKQRIVEPSDIRDDKIFIRLERDAPKSVR
jgi:hypothetical protein